jgi:hypothetical protein
VHGDVFRGRIAQSIASSDEACHPTMARDPQVTRERGRRNTQDICMTLRDTMHEAQSLLAHAHARWDQNVMRIASQRCAFEAFRDAFP